MLQNCCFFFLYKNQFTKLLCVKVCLHDEQASCEAKVWSLPTNALQKTFHTLEVKCLVESFERTNS